MPFGLTNAGASFCRLMEMCIGDQQYVTLLFYLDDICVFAENADDMLDRVELVFQRLKSFNLKVKPKKSFYFQDEVNFLGHILSAKGVSPTRKRWRRSKIGLSPLIRRKSILLSVSPHTIGNLYQTSPNGPDHYTLSLYLTAPP